MAILLTCECGQQYKTVDENAGRSARCLGCGRELAVPAGGPSLGDDFATLEPPVPITSGKAILSLILGVCSLVCVFFTGLPAIVFGCLGLKEVNRSRGRLRGAWMSVTGIALGALGSSAVSVMWGIPVWQALTENTHRAACTNNLKEIGLAMHNFASTHNRFPAATINDKEGRPLLSWRVALLPHLGPEATSLYQKFNLHEPWDSPQNIALLREMPRVYACPSEPNLGRGQTTYQVVFGPRTMFTGGKGVKVEEVSDGTANTILVAEVEPAVPWTAPQDLELGDVSLASWVGSSHPGGFQVVMVDGSVRFIKKSIKTPFISAMMTRDGGEVVPSGGW